MKARILNEGFDRDGRSVIAMWTDLRTINQRRDGSFYTVANGKRLTVERKPDGSFYLATRPGDAQ